MKEEKKISIVTYTALVLALLSLIIIFSLDRIEQKQDKIIELIQKSHE